jgi:ribose/xylose/arabinose/galactoside ABC-type transport system permease subunit
VHPASIYTGTTVLVLLLLLLLLLLFAGITDFVCVKYMGHKNVIFTLSKYFVIADLKEIFHAQFGYRVFQEESAILWENVPEVQLH